MRPIWPFPAGHSWQPTADDLRPILTKWTLKNGKDSMERKARRTALRSFGISNAPEAPEAIEAPDVVNPLESQPSAEEAEAPAALETRTIVIEVPLVAAADMPERAHENRHIDVNRLDIRLARIWKRLTIALDVRHARLSSGRHVDAHSRYGGSRRGGADAIRWLLEQIAEADERE
jgi:hypothetical protein